MGLATWDLAWEEAGWEAWLTMVVVVWGTWTEGWELPWTGEWEVKAPL